MNNVPIEALCSSSSETRTRKLQKNQLIELHTTEHVGNEGRIARSNFDHVCSHVTDNSLRPGVETGLARQKMQWRMRVRLFQLASTV